MSDFNLFIYKIFSSISFIFNFQKNYLYLLYKKNDFELMISIYLFTKKSQFIFSISFAFNFQKSYLQLLYQKKLLHNFNLDTKIILLAFTRK